MIMCQFQNTCSVIVFSLMPFATLHSLTEMLYLRGCVSVWLLQYLLRDQIRGNTG